MPFAVAILRSLCAVQVALIIFFQTILTGALSSSPVMTGSDRIPSFPRALPASRLGQSHSSLDSFRKATQFEATKSKEYTLIVITEPKRQRILLGLKRRGFGIGMFNSFGGKIDSDETPVDGAVRELQEETGIVVPVSEMEKRQVGILHFTFEDSPTEMIVHVFRLDVSLSATDKEAYRIDPDTIRPCEEITPQWFESWYDIPLDNMFADDSLWLTTLLDRKEELALDGYFHFKPGGQEVNTILHYYMNARPKKEKQRTLEQRLFHELHSNKIHSPSIKEFKESYAFTNTVRSFFGKNSFDLVIDVAGGHGALAALLLITTSANTAVVLDPANVGNQSVERAWGGFLKDKTLRYRHECLRTGLPEELARATVDKSRILVVACHACQHLSDEILSITCSHGVSTAVMPCCQKDTSPGSSWKATSKNLGIPIEKVMDLLLAGKVMSWTTGQEASVAYDVRMKSIDATITPQNRIILCRPQSMDAPQQTLKVERAHKKLALAYRKAHMQAETKKNGDLFSPFGLESVCLKSAAIGTLFGVMISAVVSYRK